MHDKKAFTLLEVLLSIFILFTTGLALLKFDGWIKEEMGRYRQKAMLLYTSTPILYNSRRSGTKKENVYDTIRFPKLRDDEVFWLRSLSAKVKVGKGEKTTLFKSGDLDLTYYLYPVSIERDETKMSFIRIVP